MSLWLVDDSVVPPEGWTYRIEQTGITINTRNYSRLYPLILEHCKSNNIEPPSWQDVIDQMCAEIHLRCADGREPLINKMGLPFVRPASQCCNPTKAVSSVEEFWP